MDLEHRVKMLEQEVKILKNQVQKTLLDIQEQILIHYHPALRAEDTTLPDTDAASLESSLAKQQKSRNGPIGSENGTFDEEEATRPPNVRKVSLEEIRAVQAATESQPPSSTPVKTDWDVLGELTKWVDESVKRLGVERTRKVVEMRDSRGALTTEEKETVLQLISLYEEGE